MRRLRVLPPAGLYFLQVILLEENRGLPFGVTRKRISFFPYGFLRHLSSIATGFLFLSTACIGAGETLVDVQKAAPGIRIDIRYATENNFMKERMYPEARCLLIPEAAAALSRVQTALEKEGLGLKVFDAYRPLSVQKKMWAKVPVEGYVANPAKGSNHNRGAAVDLTLVDKAGNELPMPSDYDEFTPRAHRNYKDAPKEAIRNREILEKAMTREGFRGISTEWWHFDYKDAKKYPILDLPFQNIKLDV